LQRNIDIIARRPTLLSPESPLEAIWLEQATERLSPDVRLELQVGVHTPNGGFRIDAVLSHPRRRSAGIELDGADWHHLDLDRLRDAAILATGSVDPILRVRGKDLFHHPDLTWWLIARRIPWAFTQRMHAVLESQLADIPAICGPYIDPDHAGSIHVPLAESGDRGPEVRVTYHTNASFHIRRHQRILRENAGVKISDILRLDLLGRSG